MQILAAMLDPRTPMSSDSYSAHIGSVSHADGPVVSAIAARFQLSSQAPSTGNIQPMAAVMNNDDISRSMMAELVHFQRVRFRLVDGFGVERALSAGAGAPLAGLERAFAYSLLDRQVKRCDEMTEPAQRTRSGLHIAQTSSTVLLAWSSPVAEVCLIVSR